MAVDGDLLFLSYSFAVIEINGPTMGFNISLGFSISEPAIENSS